MPALQVRLAESAVVDLEEIKTWFADKDAVDVGASWLGRILGAIEMLADHPDMGRVVPEFNQPRLREILVPPFRIVYLRDPDIVRVVRVWRSERTMQALEAD